eukprot:352366-Pyramimonas_sp.AAC.1
MACEDILTGGCFADSSVHCRLQALAGAAPGALAYGKGMKEGRVVQGVLKTVITRTKDFFSKQCLDEIDTLKERLQFCDDFMQKVGACRTSERSNHACP